jgi:hypothetical protein
MHENYFFVSPGFVTIPAHNFICEDTGCTRKITGLIEVDAWPGFAPKTTVSFPLPLLIFAS